MFASSLQCLKSKLSEWIGQEVEIILDTDDFMKEPIDTDIKFDKLPLFTTNKISLYNNSIMVMTPKENFVIVKNTKRSKSVNIQTTQLQEAQELVKMAFGKSNLPDFYLNGEPWEINDVFPRLKPGIILVAIFPGEMWTVSKMFGEVD